MSPPQYSDLGKAAKDLFDKGFNYGFTKVDLKTKTGNGIEFTSKGASTNETGKINGSLETKFKQSKHGLTFTEKWTTDNNLATEVAIEDQIATGLKTTLCTAFSPNTGKKTGALKTAYKCDYTSVNLDTDFDFAGPTLQGAAVIGYEGWLAGYQFAFDTSKSALTKNNVALGYTGSDVQLLCTINDATEFGGSVYHSISDKLAVGVQLAWAAGQNNTRFGVASKFDIDADASVSSKVNNAGQIGFGYSHRLRQGVKLTLSTLVEGKNFNEGGHKLGLGVEFEL